jgi:hypothetical protein
MYPKNEGKRVHVPPDEKTCGHAVTEIRTGIHKLLRIRNQN